MGKSIYFDDCGAWSSGTSPRMYFVIESEYSVKSVVVKNGVCVREKKVNKTRTYVELNPQPTELKRNPAYRRRVSWIQTLETTSLDTRENIALVEYQGNYPRTPAPHGSTKKHEDDEYVRSDRKTLQKISELSKCRQTPREIYKTLTAEDSFNAPRDFKQCQNKVHQERKKVRSNLGRRYNFADEVLDSMEMVDKHEMVQNKLSNPKTNYPVLCCSPKSK